MNPLSTTAKTSSSSPSPSGEPKANLTAPVLPPPSTPTKDEGKVSEVSAKTPRSTPRHRRNRVAVSQREVSEAIGAMIGKPKPEHERLDDSKDDDDVFHDKLIEHANRKAELLSEYKLNNGVVGGPEHGIVVRDFAYAQECRNTGNEK